MLTWASCTKYVNHVGNFQIRYNLWTKGKEIDSVLKGIEIWLEPECMGGKREETWSTFESLNNISKDENINRINISRSLNNISKDETLKRSTSVGQ